MRAVVQRVQRAAVRVEDRTVAEIGPGLLILLGVAEGDDEAVADRLADKLLALRIFEDAEGRMNVNVADAGGELLCVSNFTVYGDTRRGNRPSFTQAAPPALAEPLVERFQAAIAAYGLKVAGGIFGAHMEVELVNDGPVTIWLDSEEL